MDRHLWKTVFLMLAAGTVLTGCVPLLAAGGVAGTAAVATDRRTGGAYVDDQSFELKASNQLNKIPNAHINVTSFNRAILLTGEVPTAQERDRAELAMKAMPGVRQVYNYTEVGKPSEFGQRSNDTLITTKVVSRLKVGDGNYSSNAIKVVTERGVVYLMGLVTREEGAAATAVVSRTAGVQKVVTLFEYLNSVPGSTEASAAQ